MTISEALQWGAIVLVGVMSAARLSRLIVTDDWPPTVWLRIKWDTLTHDGPWALLVHCAFCMGTWTWAVVFGWGLVWDWPTLWWIINGWLAGAYATAMVHTRDTPESER